MVITKSKPYTGDEIDKLKEQFDVYIKTVIDIKNKVCCAGMDRHFEGEKVLIDRGSHQKNIWGGGIDLETNVVDFNSFINIRPNDNNTSNEIQDINIRREYEKLTRYFFKKIYG